MQTVKRTPMSYARGFDPVPVGSLQIALDPRQRVLAMEGVASGTESTRQLRPKSHRDIGMEVGVVLRGTRHFRFRVDRGDNPADAVSLNEVQEAALNDGADDIVIHSRVTSTPMCADLERLPCYDGVNEIIHRQEAFRNPTHSLTERIITGEIVANPYFLAKQILIGEDILTEGDISKKSYAQRMQSVLLTGWLCGVDRGWAEIGAQNMERTLDVLRDKRYVGKAALVRDTALPEVHQIDGKFRDVKFQVFRLKRLDERIAV